MLTFFLLVGTFVAGILGGIYLERAYPEKMGIWFGQ